ncbi:MAG: dockerin type I domain-containing protein [Firmicutes bacterium]|nr:dockerin type I domain-containing protein [Bacillota bacterium]
MGKQQFFRAILETRLRRLVALTLGLALTVVGILGVVYFSSNMEERACATDNYGGESYTNIQQLKTPEIFIYGGLLKWQQVPYALQAHIYHQSPSASELNRVTTFTFNNRDGYSFIETHEFRWNLRNNEGENLFAIVLTNWSERFADSDISNSVAYYFTPFQIPSPQITIRNEVIYWQRMEGVSQIFVYIQAEGAEQPSRLESWGLGFFTNEATGYSSFTMSGRNNWRNLPHGYVSVFMYLVGHEPTFTERSLRSNVVVYEKVFREPVVAPPQPRLETPEIRMEGSTIIWDRPIGSTVFPAPNIFRTPVGGGARVTVAAPTAWSVEVREDGSHTYSISGRNIPVGEHYISISLRGSGYLDSFESNHVLYNRVRVPLPAAVISIEGPTLSFIQYVGDRNHSAFADVYRMQNGSPVRVFTHNLQASGNGQLITINLNDRSFPVGLNEILVRLRTTHPAFADSVMSNIVYYIAPEPWLSISIVANSDTDKTITLFSDMLFAPTRHFTSTFTWANTASINVWRSVTWESSDPDVFSVYSWSGTVTARSAGTATLTVFYQRDRSIYDTITITVVEQDTPTNSDLINIVINNPRGGVLGNAYVFSFPVSLGSNLNSNAEFYLSDIFARSASLERFVLEAETHEGFAGWDVWTYRDYRGHHSFLLQNHSGLFYWGWNWSARPTWASIIESGRTLFLTAVIDEAFVDRQNEFILTFHNPIRNTFDSITIVSAGEEVFCFVRDGELFMPFIATTPSFSHWQWLANDGRTLWSSGSEHNYAFGDMFNSLEHQIITRDHFTSFSHDNYWRTGLLQRISIVLTAVFLTDFVDEVTLYMGVDGETKSQGLSLTEIALNAFALPTDIAGQPFNWVIYGTNTRITHVGLLQFLGGATTFKVVAVPKPLVLELCESRFGVWLEIIEVDYVRYLINLAAGNSLALLLTQFAVELEHIVVVGNDGQVITALGATNVATGITIKLVDGDNVLDKVVLVLAGDTNGDGIVNVSDVAYIYMHDNFFDSFELAGAFLLAADINRDGIVNISDVAYIYMHDNFFDTFNLFSGLFLRQQD